MENKRIFISGLPNNIKKDSFLSLFKDKIELLDLTFFEGNFMESNKKTYGRAYFKCKSKEDLKGVYQILSKIECNLFMEYAPWQKKGFGKIRKKNSLEGKIEQSLSLYEKSINIKDKHLIKKQNDTS